MWSSSSGFTADLSHHDKKYTCRGNDTPSTGGVPPRIQWPGYRARAGRGWRFPHPVRGRRCRRAYHEGRAAISTWRSRAWRIQVGEESGKRKNVGFEGWDWLSQSVQGKACFCESESIGAISVSVFYGELIDTVVRWYGRSWNIFRRVFVQGCCDDGDDYSRNSFLFPLFKSFRWRRRCIISSFRYSVMWRDYPSRRLYNYMASCAIMRLGSTERDSYESLGTCNSEAWHALFFSESA